MKPWKRIELVDWAPPGVTLEDVPEGVKAAAATSMVDYLTVVLRRGGRARFIRANGREEKSMYPPDKWHVHQRLDGQPLPQPAYRTLGDVPEGVVVHKEPGHEQFFWLGDGQCYRLTAKGFDWRADLQAHSPGPWTPTGKRVVITREGG